MSQEQPAREISKGLWTTNRVTTLSFSKTLAETGSRSATGLKFDPQLAVLVSEIEHFPFGHPYFQEPVLRMRWSISAKKGDRSKRVDGADHWDAFRASRAAKTRYQCDHTIGPNLYSVLCSTGNSHALPSQSVATRISPCLEKNKRATFVLAWID